MQGSGSEEMLGRDEVIRRLRLLGQPATLFGEVGSPHPLNIVVA